MKSIVLGLLLFPLLTNAQEIIEPTLGLVPNKYLKAGTETFEWFFKNKESKTSFGEVTYTYGPEGDNWLLVTEVKLKGASVKWLDTTLVHRKTMRPIYHSSVNAQRRMELFFEEGRVGGFYQSFNPAKIEQINDEASRAYFDSNIYPFLIRWLNYKTGYQAILPIYDMQPGKTKRELEVQVINTAAGVWKNAAGEDKPVWVVQVVDGIDPTGVSTYYIDQATRVCYLQEIVSKGRTMLMERKQ